VKKSYLFAAVSIFFWSTTATATKLLLSSFTALQILSVTSPVAFLFLLVLCAVKGEFEELRCMKLREILLTLGVGALGTFFYNFLLYQAIGMMAASQAFIINYLWPLMTVLFAVPILKEKMTLRKALALCLAFSGVIVVTSGGAFSSFSKDSLKGSVICISAAVVYGLFSALTKRSSVSRYLAMMLAYGIAVAPVVWTASRIAVLVFMIIGGTILFGVIFILHAAMCFFTIEGIEWMNVFTYGAREYGSYPADVYGKAVLKFCTYAIPYALIQYYPMLYLLGRTDHFAYGLAPIAAAWFALPCIALWKYGVSKYKSTGS